MEFILMAIISLIRQCVLTGVFTWRVMINWITNHVRSCRRRLCLSHHFASHQKPVQYRTVRNIRESHSQGSIFVNRGTHQLQQTVKSEELNVRVNSVHVIYKNTRLYTRQLHNLYLYLLLGMVIHVVQKV